MARLKEIWKKLKYWQKGGIVFGVFHIIVLSISIFLLIIGEKGVLLIIIFLEFPSLLVSGPLFSFVFKREMTIPDFAGYYWMVGFAFGTATWSLIGAFIGYLIDIIKNLGGDKK